LDENDDWRKSEKEYKKVGIAFIRDKEAGEEVNEALKLKAVEIPRLFGEQDKISFESTYHINKIDKQMQFFDKVRIVEVNKSLIQNRKTLIMLFFWAQMS